MRTAEELRCKTLKHKTEQAELLVEQIKRNFNRVADEATRNGEDYVSFPQAKEKDVPPRVIELAVTLLRADKGFDTFRVDVGTVAMRSRVLISWQDDE